MKNVKIKKSDLLSKITENRGQHRRIFEEALVGYRAAAIDELDRALKDARDGKRIRRGMTLVEPVDHTSEYGNIIEMLNLTVESVIELEWHDFLAYVRDEWGWKQQFLLTNARYSSTAATEVGG